MSSIEEKSSKQHIVETGRRLWRQSVPHDAREAAHRLIQFATRTSPEMRALRALRHGKANSAEGPFLVSGLFKEAKGVSEIARLTVAGLQMVGFDPALHDLRDTLDSPIDGVARLPPPSSAGVWILHANPPEAVHALQALNPVDLVGKRRIGYWNWELPRVPPNWVRLAPAFHEIWVPSQFVKAALIASNIRVPVRVVPPPVATNMPLVARRRDAFGIKSTMAILVMGDLHSSADRKNLIGAIDIYRRAFPEISADTALIVKTQSEGRYPEFRAAAAVATAGRQDIRFISDTLPPAQIQSLIASCDILLSPHRAEGFGLSLAEAFLSDVPALATGWSGNLDFMSSVPELLIDYSLVPTKDRYGIYEGGDQQLWAEPNVDDAVTKLRMLAGAAGLRRDLASRGKAAVLKLSESWRPDGDIAQSLYPFTKPASDEIGAG